VQLINLQKLHRASTVAAGFSLRKLKLAATFQNKIYVILFNLFS
jgi:hypothetical protein